MSGISDGGTKRQTRFRKLKNKGALLRAVQVRWSWDRRGSKPGRRRRGSEEQAESESGADVGRSQADDDGDCSGRGYLDTDKDVGLRL